MVKPRNALSIKHRCRQPVYLFSSFYTSFGTIVWTVKSAVAA